MKFTFLAIPHVADAANLGIMLLEPLFYPGKYLNGSNQIYSVQNLLENAQ